MLKIERIKWLFTLEQDFSYQTTLSFTRDLTFYSDKGNLLVNISKDGCITVCAGYSWDGCTPKFKLGSYSIGTYDGYLIGDKPATYYASLGGGSTVTQAKFHADLAGNAAAISVHLDSFFCAV